MSVLRKDSVLIMDGAVKLYRRERSRKWQAAFQIGGKYIRISTGKSDLEEAKQTASDSYLEYKFRQKNGVPVVSKRLSDVAKLCIAEMNKQLESGVGKKVYCDYVIVLKKYLIPFFGKMHVTSIIYETLQKFARWRERRDEADEILVHAKPPTANPSSAPLLYLVQKSGELVHCGAIHV